MKPLCPNNSKALPLSCNSTPLASKNLKKKKKKRKNNKECTKVSLTCFINIYKKKKIFCLWCCVFIHSDSVICARVLEGDRNIELFGIESNRTRNILVKLRLDQFSQNVSSGSDHEVQIERHWMTCAARCTVDAQTSSTTI